MSCTFSSSITVAGCTPDTGPAVPALWGGATQPARIRMVNFSDFLNALDICPTCIFQGIAPPVWDGTLPQQVPSNPSTIGWFTAGGAPPAITANYYLSSPNTNYLAIQQVRFFASQYWKFELFCFNNLGNLIPTPVWAGYKTVGLTPIDQAGTYILSPLPGDTLSRNPACVHFEAY